MWTRHTLTIDDATLVYYTAGNGPVLLWINGGPGDNHQYLRTIAEPFTAQFTCVLYDQRGCGESKMPTVDETTVSIDHYVSDIEALRVHLDVDRITLVGHSWGAMLALVYSAIRPEHVSRQVLVGLGPLTRDAASINHTNLRKPLNRHDRYLYDVLRGQRKVAVAQREDGAQARLHKRIVTDFYSRAWFYSAEIGRRWAENYVRSYDHNPYLAGILLGQFYAMDVLSMVNSLAMPTLVVYGHQDTADITQAYVLAEHMTYVRIRLLNECGHYPWLEQPDLFFAELTRFLGTATGNLIG